MDNYFECLENTLSSVATADAILICGDFNARTGGLTCEVLPVDATDNSDMVELWTYNNADSEKKRWRKSADGFLLWQLADNSEWTCCHGKQLPLSVYMQ